MQSKYSSTQLGIAAIVAGYFLMNAGFTEQCSNEIISNGGVLVLGAWTWYKRYQAGDVTIFGKRTGA